MVYEIGIVVTDKNCGMTTVTPWRQELKAANKVLKTKRYFLMDERCRLRINPKADKNRCHHIQLDGKWRGSEKETSRRLFTKLKEDDIQGSISRALTEAKELITKGQIGQDTRRNLETYDARPLQRATLSQAAQRDKALEFIGIRGENKHNGDRTMTRQEVWVDLCFAHIAKYKQRVSIDSFAEALLNHYGDRSRKSYKDAMFIMQSVCTHLQEPDKLSEALKPTYRYQVKPNRFIPDDNVIAERIDAIKDEEEKRLVYAIGVYGHRIMQIYSTLWDKLNPQNGWVPYWATKSNKECLGIPCPFGDLRVDLSGWKPENFEELFVYGERPSGKVAILRDQRSTVLSNLVTARLNLSATDLRHRYGSVSLLTGLHQNASECAHAMGNSAAVVEKTYAIEIKMYKRRQHEELLKKAQSA